MSYYEGSRKLIQQEATSINSGSSLMLCAGPHFSINASEMRKHYDRQDKFILQSKLLLMQNQKGATMKAVLFVQQVQREG